ncbi:MAG TPA: LysM peptidoglycan-binding domain-containing protein, partial [Anaerolineales bacterium]|nr:LysM peptidoglycan-binding domain-containing protein [Anaerolineales bacterium]
KPGQRLFIPDENTAGYATPTPFGMFVPATPDADGKIIHEVQPYQALITISEAYSVPVDRILVLNGWQQDWPLQIGQKLVIDPGHVTPSPTLSNIQKLTPEADGNYYHIVNSGETLSWISGFYEIPLADLMSWNGLNNTSVIYPGQKLVLRVTPPATATLTPNPITITSSPTPSIIITSSPTATPLVPQTASPRRSGLGLTLGVLTIVIGGLLWWRFSRKS